jgi:hypothetical protein
MDFGCARAMDCAWNNNILHVDRVPDQHCLLARDARQVDWKLLDQVIGHQGRLRDGCGTQVEGRSHFFPESLRVEETRSKRWQG